jgi:hypothetical protein
MPLEADIYRIALDGPRAYLHRVSVEHAITVVDISDPGHPVLRGSVACPEQTYQAAVDEDLLYLTGQELLHVYDVADADAPALIGVQPVAAAGPILLDGAPVVVGRGHLFVLPGACRTPVAVTPPDEDAPQGAVPAPARLLGGRPNPFNPRTDIIFELDRPQRVTLTVHDLTGAVVARLADGVYGAGRHALTWKGRDAAGAPVASGSYLVRMVTPARTAVAKIGLVR